MRQEVRGRARAGWWGEVGHGSGAGGELSHDCCRTVWVTVAGGGASLFFGNRGASYALSTQSLNPRYSKCPRSSLRLRLVAFGTWVSGAAAEATPPAEASAA